MTGRERRLARVLAGILIGAFLLGAVEAVRSSFTAGARAASTFEAAPVFPPRLVQPPTVTGTPREGETLRGEPATWARHVDATSGAWLRCGDPCVEVATGPEYELGAADVGTRIRYRHTATNAGGSTSATSAPTADVVAMTPPANTTAPTVSGTAKVGATLTATDGTWSGQRLTITRRWLRCTPTCTAIPNETEPAYLVTGDDAGATIKAEATATNARGTATAASTATGTVQRATYTQILCADPDTGLGVANDGVLPGGLQIGGSLAGRFDGNAPTRCAEGTAGQGILLSTGGTYTTTVPNDRIVLEYRMLADLQFAGATLYRFGSMGGNWSWAIQTANDTGLFQGPRAEVCSWGDGCTSRGSATDRFGAQNRVDIQPGPVDGFNVTLACDIPAGRQCDANGNQIVRIFGGTATLRDTATPKLAAPPTGGLTTHKPLQPTEDLDLTATDGGSGLYRVRVRIGDAEVATRIVHDNTGFCRDADPGNQDDFEFPYRRPCALSVAAGLQFDTTTWPKTGRLRVYLEDAGRNTTTIVNRALG